MNIEDIVIGGQYKVVYPDKSILIYHVREFSTGHVDEGGGCVKCDAYDGEGKHFVSGWFPIPSLLDLATKVN